MTAVAVCQFAPTGSREDNRARIAEMTADAARQGAALIVFPEYSSYFVNPMDESLAVHAEPLDGPFTAHLRELAGRHGVVVVAGLVEEASAARVRNTVVAVGPDGVLAVYRKQHLYDAFGQTESDWIEPGELAAPETFELDGLRIGLMTCYDLRFPEASRVLVDAGAEVIVVPAEWVRGSLKEHQWRTLLTARAIENTAYVVAADHPGPVGVGHSMIVDPRGVVLTELGTEEEAVAVAPLDGREVEKVRSVNPALELRRYRVSPR